MEVKRPEKHMYMWFNSEKGDGRTNAKKLFKEIVAKSFPNLMKIQWKAQWISSSPIQKISYRVTVNQ